MSEEQEAALDPNMPPETETTEEVVEQVEQAESAPVEQEDAPANKVQERINKITADKYAEKRAREEAERKIDELQSKLSQISTHNPEEEPKLEDYDYDDSAYQSALIDYKVDKKAEEVQQQQEQAIAREKAQKVANSFNDKVAEFSRETPDYLDVIANIPQLDHETLNAVMLADDGPKVAYYLGKHLDVADELAGLPPIQAAIRIGQISAQLTAQNNQAQTSAAPEPVDTLSTGGAITKDVGDMSMEEIYGT